MLPLWHNEGIVLADTVAEGINAAVAPGRGGWVLVPPCRLGSCRLPVGHTGAGRAVSAPRPWNVL
jgi:hypothetical protein